MTIRVSPSQIKVVRRCERKWAFKYIDRLPEPTTAKQQFGTDGHSHLEEWIKKGVAPPNNETGQAAKQLIRQDFIPAPSPQLARWVEKKVEIPVPHIHPEAQIRGYSDLIVPPALLEPVIVADYKFTSSLRWALTPKKAEKDPQALIYGRYGMDVFGTDEAVARFLYAVASNPRTGPRRPAGARKVEVRFKRHEEPFESGWAGIERDVKRIVVARLNWKSANDDARPNPAACGDFGGCPFADRCKLPKGGRLAAAAAASTIDEEKELSQWDNNATVASPATNERKPTMNLMEKLRSRQQGGQEPAPPPPVADSPDPRAAPPAPSGTPLLARLQSMAQEQGVNPPPTEQADPAQPDGVALVNDDTPVDGADSDRETIVKLEGMSIKELKAQAKSMGLKGYSTLPKSALVAMLSAAVETFSKECLGEAPPVTAPAEAQAPAPQVDETPVETPAPEVTAQPQAPKAEGPGLMVLFDAVPRKGMDRGRAVENLPDWIRAVTDQVARDNEVEHFGLIDYAKGAPALAAALERAFEEQPPQGCVIVDSYSMEGRAVKDVLIRHAAIVIQGVR